MHLYAEVQTVDLGRNDFFFVDLSSIPGSGTSSQYTSLLDNFTTWLGLIIFEWKKSRTLKSCFFKCVNIRLAEHEKKCRQYKTMVVQNKLECLSQATFSTFLSQVFDFT